MDEDKRLYKDFLNGNKKSFEVLIDKYIEKIIYFIYGFVKNYDIAEDLAQDVFMYLLVNREKYNFNYSFKTYIFLIAKSRAFDYLKSSRFRHEILVEFYKDEDEANQIEDVVFENIRNKNLQKAISNLNNNQRQAVYLAKIEDMKIKEISQILNISENNVKILIHRGIKNLRKIIGEESDLYV